MDLEEVFSKNKAKNAVIALAMPRLSNENKAKKMDFICDSNSLNWYNVGMRGHYAPNAKVIEG